jgi:NADH-quinone oxidoreductase subunit K
MSSTSLEFIQSYATGLSGQLVSYSTFASDLGFLRLLVITCFIVFWIGLTGIFFNRRLVISILLAVELTLLSINLLLLSFSAYLDDLVGVVLALYVLCVAAAESAVGLALIMTFYRVRRTVSVEYISLLRG